MNHQLKLFQDPPSGKHIKFFQGDKIVFRLFGAPVDQGTAWVRTNIGHGSVYQREVIEAVMHDTSRLGMDWFDIPMKPETVNSETNCFKVTLPLHEVGHFEAKCFFLPEHETFPVWTPGDNVAINVHPVQSCGANSIYNAFVRQFGPNKDGQGPYNEVMETWIQSLDRSGYAVIPPSGTFRALIKELDFIIGKLGCRFIQLLPIHPVPTTFARMGRFGSPYAALNFTAVDPALAEFDPYATPLEQFSELVDEIHQRNGRLILDIAINHTGWGATLHETHPQFLARDEKGRIVVPGAWGILWEDLAKLDYSHRDLWKYMADVFLTWCRRGVDGFRCDAGYMVPIPAWQFIVASVREQFPDTLFLVEGLGGDPLITKEMLNIANFDWAYSELFQNYERYQIEYYLPECNAVSMDNGIMIHFAETHDNNRLASQSTLYARMRTALCALFSHQGGFAFANGVEWFATEKIDVHRSPSLNWGNPDNQVDFIRRLNLILKHHPCFYHPTQIDFIHQGAGNHLALRRHHLPSDTRLLILVNLDTTEQTRIIWDGQKQGFPGTDFVDLLTGKNITVSVEHGLDSITLNPGEVYCLTQKPDDLSMILSYDQAGYLLPERIRLQQLKTKVMEIYSHYHGLYDVSHLDMEQLAQSLSDNPLSFCVQFSKQGLDVVSWRWPRDTKRAVMVPPGHFLLVFSPHPFRAQLYADNTINSTILKSEESIDASNGEWFALFSPLLETDHHCEHRFALTVYSNEKICHDIAHLLYLSRSEHVHIQRCYHRDELLKTQLTFLSTNGRGAMIHMPVCIPELRSRYDCMLGANLNSDCPEDRWIFFTRCRGWIVYQGYSTALNKDCLQSFWLERQGHGIWQFLVPAGQGEHVKLFWSIQMIHEQNQIQMVFYRASSTGSQARLHDQVPVQLILRPDVDNRSYHDLTKAYLGPEHHWPKVIHTMENGFRFAPGPKLHELHVTTSQGTFNLSHEWQYMLHLDHDAERGFEPHLDLFSPGYFSIQLKGDEMVVVTASIEMNKNNQPVITKRPEKQIFTYSGDQWFTNWVDTLRSSLEAYIVNRGNLKSIIAGYPWFLDWGRDSLIVCRGLIASGQLNVARQVLLQFGRFEKNGTLPNMIRGIDAGNRDTSDAPLWFFMGCKEFIESEKNSQFLEMACDNRTIRDILISIGRHMVEGTENGIRMDKPSGLLYSPSHFSWMDTNHPAGTPRQGYPIEIQALWYSAVHFLSKIDPSEYQDDWQTLARKIKSSIQMYYLLKEGYLSDCLYTNSNQSPTEAGKDDSLRPNQLFAITLGAIQSQALARNIVNMCEELLIPGAIRSLADKQVKRPHPIYYQETLLNNPVLPYKGKYTGNEEWHRKPAYHNGTAWTWIFPVYAEALVEAYGKKAISKAMAILSSATQVINQGCIGQTPEILDGDYPHIQRGCDAQAWGISELLRVYVKLQRMI
ncbi:MAG: glycogen debranching enzyme N-terminal domain-containing protein [Desulfobacterales bacterium]|nr:glycogen debranching enzyme N-terminal domain-containing protein [Desulfobacterales bacterium]